MPSIACSAHFQKDGQEERDRFIDQIYKVKNAQKTDFDYVVYDSDVERQFAELLDSREDIKLFMKLPARFKVPTPVGDYNPDWAILKQEGGQEKIYMIRGSNGFIAVVRVKTARLSSRADENPCASRNVRPRGDI